MGKLTDLENIASARRNPISKKIPFTFCGPLCTHLTQERDVCEITWHVRSKYSENNQEKTEKPTKIELNHSACSSGAAESAF